MLGGCNTYRVGSCCILRRAKLLSALTQARSLKRRGLAARALTDIEGLARKLADPPKVVPTQEQVQNFSWMGSQEFDRRRAAYMQLVDKPCKLNFT